MDFKKIIDTCLIQTVEDYCQSKNAMVQTAFLTGSYALGSFNKQRPNVNIYFISSKGKSIELRWNIQAVWQKVRQLARKEGVDFLIDCHPYTVSYRDSTWRNYPYFSLTTKVFDGGDFNKRFNLPPTIGLGWIKKYKVLWGDETVFDSFKITPRPDIEWMQGLHEALSYYRNILDHLPSALPWYEWPALLAEESLRYAEESIRDGIAVTLTQDELVRGTQFEIYHNWKELSLPYFRERYGEDGVWAVKCVQHMKKCISTKESHTEEAARQIWNKSLKVWQVIWNRYQQRVTEDMGDQYSWLSRVNSFV